MIYFTKKLLVLALSMVVFSHSAAFSLTLKKGQVIGGDGLVYDGASPEQKENLKKVAQSTGKSAGVQGNNVYILVEDEVIFVPVQDIAGKQKETVKSIITATVVNEVTDLDLDVEKFSDNIEKLEGDVEAAISITIEEIVAEAEQSIDGLEVSGKLAEILSAANDYYEGGLSSDDIAAAAAAASQAANALPDDIQSVINEIIDAAVEAVADASSDIEAALSTWDSLSDEAKQAIVDEANANGALGCGNGVTCTTDDAENLADSLR